MSVHREPLLPPTRWASSATARLYDAQLALERRALSAAIDLAQPGPNDVVLDLGTGTAALLRLLARRPDRPRQAIGVDASAAMLSRAPALPNRWRLIDADARRIPLHDASVDVVTCAYLLHVLDQPARRAVLDEIARVLRPRGRAALVTLLEPRGVLGRALLGPGQRTICRALGPGSGWCALDAAPELARAGLHPVRRLITTRGYASLCLLAAGR